MRLANKVAIVTGASDGIGKHMAIGYAREGADVAVGYNSNREKAEAVADEIRMLGRRAIVFQLELWNWDDPLRIVNETTDAFGKVDILVNNAVARFPAAIDNVDPLVYRKDVYASIRSILAFSKAVVPIMIENGGGKIINISSIWGIKNTFQGRFGYCSTKAGINAMTRAMASELGKYRICVNGLAPGSYHTNKGGADAKAAFEKLAAERNKYIPLHYRAEAEEIIGPAVFLASSESDYLTGALLVADGGWSIAM